MTLIMWLQVYTEGVQPQQLLYTLKRLQASASDKDQTVAKCMIFNLLDEYRFFMKYPERELQITATLFGGLVHLKLVKDKQLGTVLTHIHEALLSPPGSKLFNFARQCLRQAQEELAAWPQYCSHLLQACPNGRLPAMRQAFTSAIASFICIGHFTYHTFAFQPNYLMLHPCQWSA